MPRSSALPAQPAAAEVAEDEEHDEDDHDDHDDVFHRQDLRLEFYDARRRMTPETEMVRLRCGYPLAV
jgi:hypothetical protein